MGWHAVDVPGNHSGACLTVRRRHATVPPELSAGLSLAEPELEATVGRLGVDYLDKPTSHESVTVPLSDGSASVAMRYR
jgi:hypothetical protein